jgi:hypothetical protein
MDKEMSVALTLVDCTLKDFIARGKLVRLAPLIPSTLV